jgi:signal transduction histidine kinase
VVLTFWALVVAQSLPTIMQPVDKKEIMVFLLTLLAYCITYVVLFASMKSMEILSREKQKSLHSELLQAQVDAQANEAALVRQNRHDMRFHYQTLLSMANAGELDNIIAYVKQQSESIETMTTGRFCENETINNILRVYYEKAVQSQIQITIRAAVKPQINVPSPALVTIVANILENALHGTQESKSIDPWISVSIKHKADRLVISCRNSCKYALNFLEMPDQLQGVGIHSVISTAEKYNGSCRFSAADGIFSAVVIIDE